MKKLACAALVAALVITVAPSAQADNGQKYVDAQGIAAIIDNDVGAARDRALEDARRKAVEKVVGVMVDSETLVENFQLVSDKVYSQSAGYICGEEIKNERQDEYNYYVTIHACVAQGNLEDNLLAIGICLRRLENPRTMLMIAEQNVGQNHYHGWWDRGSDLSLVEQKLMEAFNEKGFPLIDPNVASGNIRVTKAISGEPDPNDAVKVGKSFNAEYVVAGKATATCRGKDQYGFYSCYANITTRIVKVDNGRIFGSASARGKSAHIDQHESGVRALKKAAEEVAPALIKKVTLRCEKETTGGNEFKLTLSGVGSVSDLRSFIENVEGIRGVENVSRRTYGDGKAVVEVKYKGRAGDLAQQIESKTDGKVTGFTANTLKVQLK